MSAAMSEAEYISIINRQRRLPEQIRMQRRKISMLLNEAERYGMLDDMLHEEFNGDLIAMEKARMKHKSIAGITEGLVA